MGVCHPNAYLLGIESEATSRLEWSVHTEAIELAGPHVWHVAVVHLIGVLRHHDRRRLARGERRVEETQLNFSGVLMMGREIDNSHP